MKNSIRETECMKRMGIIETGEQKLIKTYGRKAVAFEKGLGARLWDEKGEEYTDFLAGIAVVNLGHAHPGVAEAVADQAKKLVHTSNLYHIGPQAELAKRLTGKSFADRAFFCNSGAEANEAALKLARKWASINKPGAAEIITTEGSFHGRTMFALSVTGQDKFHKGFEPLVPGVTVVPYNDLAAMEDAVGERTAAVIVEPVQGEGGVNIPADGYLSGLRKLCDEREALLIFDEVQTGMGRLGKLFGHEVFGVTPDVMTLAKALGNGFPVGAMLAVERAAEAFSPGTHASTFGGNFLACRAALAVLDALEDGKLLEHARETGAYFMERLEELKAEHECVLEVRGKGLLIGVELDRPGAAAVDYCMAERLIINCTADKILRFAPPLVIEKSDIDRLSPVLDAALSKLEAGA